MDGEAPGEISTHLPGEASGEAGEDLTGSGWATTKQAAKALGVSRRSVQGYVRRGILDATEEGEGVNKRFFVSIDSLNALRERRRLEGVASGDFAAAAPESEKTANLAANAGEGLRHVVDRLEARTVEATELRVRLEITERAESTVREELERERERRERAEERAATLEGELRALREAREPPGGPAPTETQTPAPGGAEEGAGHSTEVLKDWSGDVQGARRPWWRRVFGG